MRLFVALHLAAATRTGVEAIQRDLQRLDRGDRVRWVSASGIHLTLAFLGEVGEDRLARLESALDAAVAGYHAPRLGLGDPGCFPSRRRPRVVWVGLVEDGDRLGPLQAAVVEALRPLGWEPEKRAFQPHLTLGRVREESPGRPASLPEPLLAALGATGAAGPIVPHSHLALVRSHLSPQGSRYEDRRSWQLSV